MATPVSSHKHLPTDREESKVRVVVRIRPSLPSEYGHAEEKPLPCVSLAKQDGSGEGVNVHIQDQFTRNECYRLDFLYGQGCEIGQIFAREVSPLLPEVLEGHNATVFAYGATGSGKTYTMQGTTEQRGLMPLAMSSIMSMCQEKRNLVEISYYEVYLDRCYDLLEPKMKEVSVLEDKDGNIQLKGLSQISISSMEEFDEVFSRGIQRRKVGNTGLNDVSSRSHGVLMISISKTDENSNISLLGKINLIDLAGNEDNRRSFNDGLRLQESAKINQSLFALSNVIYALNCNQSRIPYRESKLTRILQDSLGGTSRALMIACLNPASYQEAVHTVSLAARSRQIVNYVPPGKKQETPRQKVDMEAKLRVWLESKGKTKTTSSCNVTPTINSAKKTTFFKSAANTKLANRIASEKRGRKLFDFQSKGPVGETMEEESSMCVSSTTRESCTSNEVVECQKDDDGNKFMVTTHYNKEVEAANESNVWRPLAVIIDQYMDKENRMSPLANTSSKRRRSSSKVFLSPVNFNINGLVPEGMPQKTQLNEVPCSSKVSTLNTSCVSNHDDDAETLPSGTPLDKFHAEGSSLKNLLIERYLTFLNKANREELMGLKGIGQKRADYILQLREQTPDPIKTLYDLEKIGMSSKQVDDMFRRAARSIFT